MGCFKKLVLFALFLLFGVGTNLHLLSLEPVDLEILWQKEISPKQIKFAQFSADGQWIYVATGSGIEKISAETGEFVSTFSNDGKPSDVWNMDVSVMGNFLVTDNGSGNVVVWDTRIEKATSIIDYSNIGYSVATRTAISPDEKYLAISVYQYKYDQVNRFLSIYNLKTNSELRKINTQYSPNVIKFSHDGKYFATGGWYEDKQHWDEHGEFLQYDQVVLWSTETWAPIDTIENLEGSGSGYQYLKFSNNDKYLVVKRPTPYDARVYNLETKAIFKKSDYQQKCSYLELLPNNLNFLIAYATSFGDYSLELHDVNSIITSYHLPVANIESLESNGVWNILCFAGYYPAILLTNKPTGVESEPIKQGSIAFSNDNNNLIIQTENLLERNLLIEISNIEGSNVLSETLENTLPNNKIILPINLPSGIYLCRVKSGDKSYTHKFEIVR